jgi:biotin carboxyl carrier protein
VDFKLDKPFSTSAFTASQGTRAAGAAVLTLEAMKMETVVRAPRAGRIKELVPALKSTVQAGDLLAILAS